ncbi:hypothetical protein [Chishuiella sp.]|uniref:hypothetical protein n=1 Tax=Chishuiella sp. TaxID=1969467 RepID=UPI0028AAD42A|nr:hypothetical protein [Chishuiella sp.]
MNQQQDFKMMELEKFIPIELKINWNGMCSKQRTAYDTPKGAILHVEKISLKKCIKKHIDNKLGYVFVTKSNQYIFRDLEKVDLKEKFIIVADREEEKNKTSISFKDIAFVLDIKKRTF